jgi:NAD(P)-dependent dehydrogenase (short-subunit alcohol dehydrogenase family)
MKLRGQCAVISGASEGLGRIIAEVYLKEGANVMICARNQEKLFKARDELLALKLGHVEAQVCDVANMSQVENLMSTAYTKFGRLDILVANAGIYGPKGPIEETNFDEWSYAIDVNLKGVFAQCRAIVPYFKKQRSGKIIVLSGGGATKPMPFLSSYAASKAAVVRFAETLAGEVAAFNIDVNCVAPGALNTRLLDEALAAGPEKVGQAMYNQLLKQKDSGGNDIYVAANLCVYLASKDSDKITGKLISAIWDPWASFETHREDLTSSDIYTLRRIIPAERGKTWGDV